MDPQLVGILVAFLALIQLSLGVALPRMNPTSALTKALNALHGFLPLAIAHMGPSVPAAMKARQGAIETAAKSAAAVGRAFALVLIGAPSTVGCSGVTSQQVVPIVEDGCQMIGIVDPSAVSIAEICSSLAPVVVPVITNLIENAKTTPKASAAPAEFVLLIFNGKVVGSARKDIAPKVQAALDAHAADGGAQ